MKKKGIIIGLFGIISQLWIIFIKIENSDMGFNLIKGRSSGLSDGIIGFFYVGFFLYLSICLFLFSIGKNNFHSNIGKKIYFLLKIDDIKFNNKKI